MSKISYPFAYFEKNIVPIEKAHLSIMTNALQYGTGIFAGIRGYIDAKPGDLCIFRLSDHYKRFYQSLKILNVTIDLTEKELADKTIELIKKNKPTEDIYVRPFAYASSLGLSPNLAKDNHFDVSMYIIPLSDYLPTDTGLKACVSSWRRVSDTAIPARGKYSGTYINSALARAQAEMRGCNEAIFLTENGHVCEGSAENIWIVRDDTLITPTVTDDVLEGITRRSIITIANDMGIPVVERTIDRSELYIADEAFFSGTGVQVAWISEIDGRRIGNGKKGPIGQKIQDTYFSTVKGKEKKYQDWITRISI